MPQPKHTISADGLPRALFSAHQIGVRVRQLASEIAAAGHRDLVVIPILTGGFVFAADLVRALHDIGVAAEIDFMTLSSYGAGTVSSGRVEIIQDVRVDVAGRTILVVDDIVETGRTLAFVRDLLIGRGAASVLLAVLCEKPGKRQRAVKPDFVGFVTPDAFVVGYGMDVGQTYRQLPFIGVIGEEG